MVEAERRRDINKHLDEIERIGHELAESRRVPVASIERLAAAIRQIREIINRAKEPGPTQHGKTFNAGGG